MFLGFVDVLVLKLIVNGMVLLLGVVVKVVVGFWLFEVILILMVDWFDNWLLFIVNIIL